MRICRDLNRFRRNFMFEVKQIWADDQRPGEAQALFPPHLLGTQSANRPSISMTTVSNLVI